MENRIKEQLSLFAGRVSAETMRANQLRLDFSAAAYVCCCTAYGGSDCRARSWRGHKPPPSACGS